MSSETFWSLTWYDWTLWMYRILYLREQRKEDHELSIVFYRNWMTFYGNSVSDLKKRAPFQPTDFWKLSYDTVPGKPEGLSDAEVMSRVKERFKKYLKPKKNG